MLFSFFRLHLKISKRKRDRGQKAANAYGDIPPGSEASSEEMEEFENEESPRKVHLILIIKLIKTDY